MTAALWGRRMKNPSLGVHKPEGGFEFHGVYLRTPCLFVKSVRRESACRLVGPANIHPVAAPVLHPSIHPSIHPPAELSCSVSESHFSRIATTAALPPRTSIAAPHTMLLLLHAQCRRRAPSFLFFSSECGAPYGWMYTSHRQPAGFYFSECQVAWPWQQQPCLNRTGGGG